MTKITPEIHEFMEQAAAACMSTHGIASYVEEFFGTKITHQTVFQHARKSGIQLLHSPGTLTTKITPEVGEFIRMALDARMTQAGIIHYIKEFWDTDIAGPSLSKHISKDQELRAKVDENQVIRKQNRLANRKDLSL